jgi:hypothetical protein
MLPMRSAVRAAAGAVISLAAIMCRSGGGLAAPPPAQVWFSPIEPFTGELKVDTTDFTEFLQDGDAWHNAASRIHVMKMSTQFLSRAPDPVLRDLFALLRRHGISLGVEALMLTGHDGCGGEGYSAPGQMAAVAERVKRLGGDLAYVAMDGPLWSGHISVLPHACRDPIQGIAAEVAAKAHAIRNIFPKAAIGDIEPAGKSQPEDYLKQMAEWTRAYRDAFGEELGFVHADVQWSGPWETQLPLLAGQLRRNGIRFGIIYNGNPDDPSGEVWVEHAEQRFVAVEADPARVPDDAILQTWHPYPRKSLPESTLGTMTSLVDRYEALGTGLSLRVEGARLSGVLNDSDHAPLQDAMVDIFAGGAPEIDPNKAAGPRQVIPGGATSAVFGLRVNIECGCSVSSEIAVGAAEFRDDQSGTAIVRHLTNRRQHWSDGTGQGPTQVSADPRDSLLVNSDPFPVTEGHHFSFHVAVHVVSGSATKSSGYVALIFLGSDGRELARQRIELVARTERIGTIETGDSGQFSIQVGRAKASSSPVYTAIFRGDPTHRMSWSLAPQQ